MSQRPELPRRTMADVLQLPDGQRLFLLWLMRREEASLADALAETGLDGTAGRALLDDLIAAGFLQESRRDGASFFKALTASRRGRQMPDEIWKNLQV